MPNQTAYLSSVARNSVKIATETTLQPRTVLRERPSVSFSVPNRISLGATRNRNPALGRHGRDFRGFGPRDCV